MAEGPLFIEIFLCQELKEGDRVYQRIIYDGLEGDTKYLVSNVDSMCIKKVSFKETSRNNVVFRLFIGLFREGEEKIKVYKDLVMSKPLFIAEPSKITFVDDKAALRKYFNSFGLEMLSPSRMGNIFTSLESELLGLENQFNCKLKRLMNIIYMSFKYTNTCEVYFKTELGMPPVPDEEHTDPYLIHDKSPKNEVWNSLKRHFYA